MFKAKFIKIACLEINKKLAFPSNITCFEAGYQLIVNYSGLLLAC